VKGVLETNLFKEKIISSGSSLKRRRIEILQVNVGKYCNLTCSHCHVESGPTKTRENMNRETAEAVVRLMDLVRAETLDLTGGAPELNPHFRYLVEEARRRQIRVMDRCNLTVLSEPGMEMLGEFLAENKVEIVASLPCYTSKNVDTQRGKGTFSKSVEALLQLNHLGYGKEETGLVLDLVYNPVGAHLPPSQEGLERDYKERLLEDFGIVFNKLYTISNMPITRYAKFLKAMDQHEPYIDLLIQQFNPKTLDGIMCRNTLSVSWDGKLYDCDFNQALGMEMGNGRPFTIFDFKPDQLASLEIQTGNHCFGCTAGAGSSCQGALD
jgi:radical SAM/Cys-rich protein